MQPQDYLPFFQDLALQIYNTSMEMPVYAGSLAVLVWLITAIFYSIRIGFIKGHLNKALKAGKEIQQALQEAEQKTLAANEEAQQYLASQEQTAQQCQVLNDRLNELAQQFTQSITALAANPELGQQGLTASQGLAPESLWQRLNAANGQLADKLLAERQALQSLQQNLHDEIAKAADQEQQMQTMQLRLDSQSQQLAKLSLQADDHKAELAAQQQASQQQLVELEARYRREMTALSASVSASKPVTPSVSIAPTTASVVSPVSQPVAAVAATSAVASTVSQAATDAFKAASAVAPVSTSAAVVDNGAAFKATAVSSSMTPTVETSVAAPKAEAQNAAVETPSVTPVASVAPPAAPKVTVKPAKAASTGKLKGFFASAKDTFKKFDQKLGSPSDEGNSAVSEATESVAAVDTLVAKQAVTSVADSASVAVQDPVTVSVAATVATSPVEIPSASEPLSVVNPTPVVSSATETASAPAPVAKKGLQLGGMFKKLKRS